MRSSPVRHWLACGGSAPAAGIARLRRYGWRRASPTWTGPRGDLATLSRFASSEIGDYRLDMALGWGAIHRVAAVAAFSGERWQPTVTARGHSCPGGHRPASPFPRGWSLPRWSRQSCARSAAARSARLAGLEQGLEAVLAAESAGGGLEDLRAAVSVALGTPVEFRPWAGDGFSAAGDAAARSASNGGSGSGGHGARPGDGTPAEVSALVVVGETLSGYFVAPDAHGDFGVAARLVLHTAALAAGRLLDLARRAHETPSGRAASCWPSC